MVIIRFDVAMCTQISFHRFCFIYSSVGWQLFQFKWKIHNYMNFQRTSIAARVYDCSNVNLIKVIIQWFLFSVSFLFLLLLLLWLDEWSFWRWWCRYFSISTLWILVFILYSTLQYYWIVRSCVSDNLLQCQWICPSQSPHTVSHTPYFAIRNKWNVIKMSMNCHMTITNIDVTSTLFALWYRELFSVFFYFNEKGICKFCWIFYVLCRLMTNIYHNQKSFLVQIHERTERREQEQACEWDSWSVDNMIRFFLSYLITWLMERIMHERRPWLS